MPAKEIKALTRRFFAEWNKGKEAAMTVMDEFYSTDVVFHWATGEDMRAFKNLKQLLGEFYDAFPDNHMTLDEMIVEEDKVAVCYTISGTHKGEYNGIPPTNKKITMWVIEIDRIVGHKCVEGWERSDTLGMMRQLGVVPNSRKGKQARAFYASFWFSRKCFFGRMD